MDTEIKQKNRLAKRSEEKLFFCADSPNTIKINYWMRQTGYQYFGARYYNSDISVWLSVDPLSNEYPAWSSYMYVAGNLVILTDPDGRWIPEIDEDNGNITYTAEKGDSYDSFKRQYKLTDDQPSKILDRNTDVVVGETVIKGEGVKDVLGTEVLKLDMWGEETTSDDWNKHAAFMINHKNYEADQNWNNWEGNVKDYFHGFEGLENSRGGKMIRKHTRVKLDGEMKRVRVTIRSGSDGRFDPTTTYGGTTGKDEVKWMIYHPDPTKDGRKFPLIIFYESQN